MRGHPHENGPLGPYQAVSPLKSSILPSIFRSESFKKSFELECEAILKVREEMGLRNVQVMLPFVRTVEEARLCIDRMATNGLARGKTDLKVHLMCEIPANAFWPKTF